MNIFRFSIERNDSFLAMIGWGIFGFVLLFAGYFIFEFLTPTFKIDEEIEKDNRAVGLISMAILIGLSLCNWSWNHIRGERKWRN